VTLCARPASADWSVAGAQYSCAAESGAFTLLPYVISSSDENPALEQGFAKLPADPENLTCALGERTLRAQIVVTGPRSFGACMGGGAVTVGSVTVDGVELLEGALMFNWQCTSESSITKITVRLDGALVELEQCTTNSELAQESPGEMKCSAKSFDVDTIAASQRAIDHRIDDAATQAQRSAARLPADNDLAQVYASRFPPDSEIPLCAHWSATFVNAIVNTERQRAGRVTGAEGERVALRPMNPQLCGESSAEGCEPTDHLMAGDRVHVGFICGAWTQVQRITKVLSEPPSKGWVETARLYDVEPMTEGTASNPVDVVVVPSADMDATFLDAIVAKDHDEVRRLVAAGTNPNGLLGFGTPLANAIELRDIDMVRTLIDAGADVNAHGPVCQIAELALRDERIFALLLAESLDLECRDSQGATPLMRIAWFHRLRVWEWLSDDPRPMVEHLRDLGAVAGRLVRAGANPNAIDPHGRTALFYASQANNVDFAKVLLELGADPNISISAASNTSYGRQQGSTPLMAAMHWYPLTSDTTMFEMLLESGADPNYRNASRYDEERDLTTRGAVTFAGQTVLTRAATDGLLSLARVALEHGADPLLPRQDGALPEAIARRHGHLEVAALIASYVKPE
jgi:ankyrin repeat protein